MPWRRLRSPATSNLDVRVVVKIRTFPCSPPPRVGLLLVVGRVLLDDNQRILLHGVTGTVVEDDLGHTFRAGLQRRPSREERCTAGSQPITIPLFTRTVPSK